MIDFVICEDNKIILQKNINIVNKAMFNNNINYRIYSFTEYNDELDQLIMNDNKRKIYILDIELGDASGLEISRKIRKYDLGSIIIISTAHTEYFPYALKAKLLIYDFISKFDDYETVLFNVIKSVLNLYPETKTLTVKIYGKTYNIAYSDIVSIEYDNKKRKTKIITAKETYEVNMPIVSIIKSLDERFVKKTDNVVVNSLFNKNKEICKKNEGEMQNEFN